MIRISPLQTSKWKKSNIIGNDVSMEFLKGKEEANDFESKMDNYVRNNAFPKLKLENAII